MIRRLRDWWEGKEGPHSCASCGREATLFFPEGWMCMTCTLRAERDGWRCRALGLHRTDQCTCTLKGAE